MNTVTQTQDPVQRVLNERPYLHRRYYPLAVFLIIKEYSDAMRNRVIDWLADGGLLESLVVSKILDPEDLDAAQAALDSGRAWERLYRQAVYGADRQPYLWRDEGRGMRDEPNCSPQPSRLAPICGGSPDLAEPPVYLPPEADEEPEAEALEEQADEDEADDDTGEYPPVNLDDLPEPPECGGNWNYPGKITTEIVEPFHPGFDEHEIQRMRDWYGSRPSFEDWLESQGGER